MKNRRRRRAANHHAVQSAPFDHDLFRRLYISSNGVEVINFAATKRLSKDHVDELLESHYETDNAKQDAANKVLLYMKNGNSLTNVSLKEIESVTPHIWLVSQEDGQRPFAYDFHKPSELFLYFKLNGIEVPSKRRRRATGMPSSPLSDSPVPLTQWIDIQTADGDTQIVQEVLSAFPVDSETIDNCLYLIGQDLIDTTHLAYTGSQAYYFINLICTPTATAQSMHLYADSEPLESDDAVDSQMTRGRSVMEMRFNAMQHNVHRSAVPAPVPVAVIAFPGWVLTIHEKPFAEMDDLLRMIRVYCSHRGEFVSETVSTDILTDQRLTTPLVVSTLVRIAVGHNIDSATLAEVVEDLGDAVFDVPATHKEQDKIIRRITDVRRCFGECVSDGYRREQVIDTLLDNEIINNFICRDAASKSVLESLQSHLRYVQHELADYRDTVAVSHWYHNVAVQRKILIRGNKSLRAILLLTEMCNIMYPVMLIQTLYSMNVPLPFDSEGEPPNYSLWPFFILAIIFAIYIFWVGRVVIRVYKAKLFDSQYIA